MAYRMSELNSNITKKLSILIPSHNVEKYILECLDSIDEQLTSECEVIVYDDASTDKTVEIIQNSSIYKNPNFNLQQGHENNGISYARNTLRKASSGEYIWFFDSDDKISSHAIKKILAAIDASDVDTVFFNFNFWLPDPTMQHPEKRYEQQPYIGAPGRNSTDHISAFAASLRSRNLHAHSKVYRRDLFIKETDFPVGHIFEDISVVPLLASLSKSIFYINEPLYDYRQRSGSIITSMKIEDHLKPLKAIVDLKNRYETVHGHISKEALSALMGFSAFQFRSAVREIIKKAPQSQKSQFLQDILNVFQSIHGKNYFYVMKTCYEERSFKDCFHITKRIIHAKAIILKYKLTKKKLKKAYKTETN